MCRTRAGLYVCRGRRYENNDIFPKCVHTFAAVTSGRSVEHWQYRPIAAGWLVGCSSTRPVHYTTVLIAQDRTCSSVTSQARVAINQAVAAQRLVLNNHEEAVRICYPRVDSP